MKMPPAFTLDRLAQVAAGLAQVAPGVPVIVQVGPYTGHLVGVSLSVPQRRGLVQPPDRVELEVRWPK